MNTVLRGLSVLSGVYIAALSMLHSQSSIGREVVIAGHLQDGEEFSLSLAICSHMDSVCSPPCGPLKRALAGR